MNHFGLEQADDGLRERVVVRAAAAVNRGGDAGRQHPLRLANREILHTAIAVMHEPRLALAIAEAFTVGLLQCIERQVAPQRGGDGLRLVFIVRRSSDGQHAADRLDSVLLSALVDEAHHHCRLFVITPTSLELEPPTIPGRSKHQRSTRTRDRLTITARP